MTHASPRVLRPPVRPQIRSWKLEKHGRVKNIAQHPPPPPPDFQSDNFSGTIWVCSQPISGRPAEHICLKKHAPVEQLYKTQLLRGHALPVHARNTPKEKKTLRKRCGVLLWNRFYFTKIKRCSLRNLGCKIRQKTWRARALDTCWPLQTRGTSCAIFITSIYENRCCRH